MMKPFLRSACLTAGWALLICVFMLSAAACPGFETGKEISIRVAQYPKTIDFTCKDGGTWSLGGRQGTIAAADKGQIVGTLGTKSVRQFHVAVASAMIGETAELEAHIKHWQQAGWDVQSHPVGTTFVKGTDHSHLGDNRGVILTIETFPSEEEAQALVGRLAEAGISSWIHAETLQAAQGTLTLKLNGAVQAVGSALTILPAEKMRLVKVEFAAGYPWHGFEDRDYRGRMVFRFGVHNTIDCLLYADLEEILAGVVPSEISANAQIGALQAQAVAARGEILAKIGWRHADEGFDTCAEQHCQVFKGETVYSIAVGGKIKSTKGFVLTKPDGALLDAVYAANCGGHGEANHLVWASPPNPILVGVWDHPNPPALDLSEEEQVGDFIRNPPPCYCNDPSVEGGNRFRWEKTYTSTEWAAVEKQLEVGRIKKVTDIARGFSGRIYQLTFVGEKGSKTVRKELIIRTLMGSLRSSCFVADWKRDAAGFITGGTLRGAGFGHGVGMCQTGAQSLAKRGWAFANILAHYFPGSSLKQWY